MVGAHVTDSTGTSNISYKYDPDGIRVASVVNGAETRFLIDSNQPYAQVLEEYTPGGVIKVSYVYGNDLISQNRGGAKSFYHVDGLGSTRALTDASGTVTDRYVYDAFGRTISQIGNTVNVYLFAGQQRDANVGLDYLRARYLDTTAGRFFGRDPFPGHPEKPSSENPYQYALLNPTNNVDPSGRVTLVETLTAVEILGIIQTNYARIEVKTLRDVVLLTKQYLAPATQQQEIGLRLMMAGVSSGYDFYAGGRELASLGFRVISGRLAGSYVEQGKALVKLSDLLKPIKQKEEDHPDAPDSILKKGKEKMLAFLGDLVQWTDALGFLYQTGGHPATAAALNKATIYGQSLIEVMNETSDEELQQLEDTLRRLFDLLAAQRTP
jgi:RHS repeat-associated protein